CSARHCALSLHDALPISDPPQRRCIGSSIVAECPITKTLASTVVYRNPWMTVREDHVERPDGSRGIYGVVDKPDFALIIPAEKRSEEHTSELQSRENVVC